MSGRHGTTGAPQRSPEPTNHAAAFVKMLQNNAPTAAQVVGLLAVVITGGLLLLITGIITTVTMFFLILLAPLIVVSSPIWVPVGSLLFIAFAGIVATCAFGAVSAAAMSWAYKYYKGLHPVGSERVDYARDRIYDTASHVKDYAIEYGGYIQSKVKYAAPGA